MQEKCHEGVIVFPNLKGSLFSLCWVLLVISDYEIHQLIWPLLLFQLELSAFRAQWMSELRPGSGVKTGLSKAADLKKTQELAREEKVGWYDAAVTEYLIIAMTV